MIPEEYRHLTHEFEPEGDPRVPASIARLLEERGNLEAAASLYDRAYALDPDNAEVAEDRQRVLDALAVVEHGLTFRYVPAGVFLMGANTGEPDEHPWHPVWLSAFWLTDTPISWADHHRLIGWATPPESIDWEQIPEAERFSTSTMLKLRYFYSIEEPGPHGESAEPVRYVTKPSVAMSWDQARAAGTRISDPRILYDLPTEAQWEKAARGGLIGAKYAWGDARPSIANCDFDRLTEISIKPSKTFPPNGYGLYAMCGGVWEWCFDWYDRDFYSHSPDTDPAGPTTGEEKVLRGGAWTDCPEACTVTFRMSRPQATDRGGYRRAELTPTIGFRLRRTLRV